MPPAPTPASAPDAAPSDTLGAIGAPRPVSSSLESAQPAGSVQPAPSSASGTSSSPAASPAPALSPASAAPSTPAGANAPAASPAPVTSPTTAATPASGPPPAVTATAAPVASSDTTPSAAPAPLAEVSAQSASGVAPQPVPAKPAGTATQQPVGSADEEIVEIVPPPAPEPTAKRSWLSRLKSGLTKTSSSLTGIFIGVKVDEALFEELETALLMADAGVDATTYLLDALRQKVRSERLTDAQQVKAALRTLLIELLTPLEQSMVLGRTQPLVMMIAGVNGAGKTTSIGKLAKHLQSFNQSVMLAAGDTFRAAAREQLVIWGQRNNVAVIQQESGDPAAVIFDAVGAARARGADVLMADTAGRLPTQLHLMEELRKVKRVIGKAMDGAPHEILLVLDANTGQNALAQVKAFDEALGLTGLIVTKLDGTAKGGILAAIARQRPVPVYFIGVGEKVEDLQPFVAAEFADALLG
ncbi:signal recognition particle-docking protein FtsY [Mycetohabitans sp. B5]|uniref:signal recognition particle-docking protein FtsY n=1 Tax=Mycetohabitans TaxID=2571159 RepID=UPI0018EAB0CA|nr:signal recognition particle-docking protein FtsY [Mycetohabitans endofungorum]MCG1055764.1 signal recognition particle-docking protein FtsY [Mycetohabitans sp. B5]